MRPRWVAYRVNNVGVWDAAKAFTGAGIQRRAADIWLCMDGRFVVIEVKAGKDRQSEEQNTGNMKLNGQEGLPADSK